MITRPAFRYHGAKFRLAPWVISHFPPHQRYVESFGGAAGVLLCKPRVYAEVYNDLDGDVVNFFRVVRDPQLCEELVYVCGTTPYARHEFEAAYDDADDVVERARRLTIRAAMGFGSAGATKSSTGFRIDSQRAYGLSAHNWARYPAQLQAVGERFAGVIIENRDALDVMTQHDGPKTMHYIDPPYVHETRSGKAFYRCELDDGGHQRLLETIKGLQGYVALSGYANELYNDVLTGWHRVFTTARISAGRGTAVREESLWLSPSTVDALNATSAGTGFFY